MLDLNPIDLQWLWTIWPTCTFAWMIGFLIVKTKPIIINKVDKIGENISIQRELVCLDDTVGIIKVNFNQII